MHHSHPKHYRLKEARHVTAAEKRTATDARTLISAEMRATLVTNMCDKFPRLTEGKADRGVGQLLAFLAACNYAGRPLSPSPLRSMRTRCGSAVT
jgi:hypothetical protein